ncbi:MAG TPA: redoxin family protein [Bryobacteraceae bacterium]|nr:redoxin family protein [Bryobacteraceae bacterium]
MLKEGDTAPKIQLLTDAGEPFDSDGMRGKKAVLYFFPRANTPG